MFVFAVVAGSAGIESSRRCYLIDSLESFIFLKAYDKREVWNSLLQVARNRSMVELTIELNGRSSHLLYSYLQR